MLQSTVIINKDQAIFEYKVNDYLRGLDKNPDTELVKTSYGCSAGGQLIAFIEFSIKDSSKNISTVVTPPSPREVKQQEKMEAESKDVRLDAQLNNPDLGNE